ncbi:MAG: HAMP domain-containing protein [Bauldia sp.]|nr:HAMP domain-containing protein [Bauldia sp.]
MRLVPRTLHGRLLLLLIGALLVTQAATLVIFTQERRTAIWQTNLVGLVERATSVARILEAAPTTLRESLVENAESPRLRLWISDSSAAAPSEATAQLIPFLDEMNLMTGRRVLLQLIRRSDSEARATPAGGPPAADPPLAADIPPSPPLEPFLVRRDGSLPPPGPPGPADERSDLIASIPLPDGGWLNAQTGIRLPQGEAVPWPTVFSTGLMALAIFLILGLTTRNAMRPLNTLATSAEALGRGAPVAPLPERGSEEVRRLTKAFNEMQNRLGRFVADRTQMLAAIGHDLRTPITSLRLRAELIEDEEMRGKIVGTLEEMQSMVEATLEFAREDSRSEESRMVDLASLLSSLADDHADMGRSVTFADAERLPYLCRPTALRRAIDNLVVNAVEHGGSARIALRSDSGGPVITVDDDGPGIPAERLEEVFKPFVRLEASRSRETGGVGLGLSIARSILLAHGGELALSNRPEGGLRAEVRLPAVPTGQAPAEQR